MREGKAEMEVVKRCVCDGEVEESLSKTNPVRKGESGSEKGGNEGRVRVKGERGS
jgi:hypothetical protein